MKRLMTLAIALVITSFAFGQDDYKHPLNKKKEDKSEKFTTEKQVETSDYKHPRTRKEVRRVKVRQGAAATSYKHPLG